MGECEPCAHLVGDSAHSASDAPPLSVLTLANCRLPDSRGPVASLGVDYFNIDMVPATGMPGNSLSSASFPSNFRSLPKRQPFERDYFANFFDLVNSRPKLNLWVTIDDKSKAK